MRRSLLVLLLLLVAPTAMAEERTPNASAADAPTADEVQRLQDGLLQAKVPMLSPPGFPGAGPEGHVYNVAEDQVAQAEAHGFRRLTPKEIDDALQTRQEERLLATVRAEDKKYFGRPLGVVETVVAGFLRGVTLGLSDQAVRLVGGNEAAYVLLQLTEVNPRASMASTAAGFVLFLGIVRLWRRRRARRRLGERWP